MEDLPIKVKANWYRIGDAMVQELVDVERDDFHNAIE